MVDTFPICVEKPEESELQHTLFHGKYRTTVCKVQLGVTFLELVVICNERFQNDQFVSFISM
jgi:hypothetical protein